MLAIYNRILLTSLTNWGWIMFIRKAALFACIFLISSTAYSAKPKTEKEWIRCSEKAAASAGNDYGMAGVNMAIDEQCGSRPIIKQKSGNNTLLKTDCDWLFSQALEECLGYTNFNCEYLPSTASTIGSTLSEKAFSLDSFISVCEQVCKSQKLPTRQSFGEKICSKRSK